MNNAEGKSTAGHGKRDNATWYFGLVGEIEVGSCFLIINTVMIRVILIFWLLCMLMNIIVINF